MPVSDLVRSYYPMQERLYHDTDKTIAIGGEGGTVAWVDLWRGIFFCDVLKKRPLLQDVPLPVPPMGNWDSILHNCDPSILRDVTISRNKKNRSSMLSWNS